MRDGPGRRLLKSVVRLAWAVEFGLRRGVRRGPPAYRLGGACQSCAKCCERPAIAGGTLTWHVSFVRRLFLSWQRVVNGFELVEVDDEAHAFLFRCAHFDWRSRRCDSYATRPFMCRDYPRGLLDQPWPELFAGCGYKVVSRNAASLGAALDALDLPAEKRAELKRRLLVDE